MRWKINKKNNINTKKGIRSQAQRINRWRFKRPANKLGAIDSGPSRRWIFREASIYMAK